MRMIPAQPGLTALYRDPDDHTIRYTLTVHAWDEDGQAMVVGENGNLTAAKSQPWFVRVDEDPNPGIVAMAPAQGWRIRYSLKDGRDWSEPLVGWAVKSDGSVQAITTEISGYADEVVCTDQCRVYHPDQDPDTEDMGSKS